MERKETLKDAMKTIGELLESGRSIGRSEYSVMIVKLTRGVQRLTGLVESKNLELQTMRGLVEEARRLREELDKVK